MGTLAIMDATGHDELHWDADKPFEVEQARKKFKEALRGGGKAFRQNHLGGQGEAIDEFDPKAEHITIVKLLVGG